MIEFVTTGILFVVASLEPGVFQVLGFEILPWADCLAKAAEIQAIANAEGAPVGAMCNPVIEPQVIANE